MIVSDTETVPCIRCRGYGIVGLGDEPGVFINITEDPCELCQGSKRILRSQALRLQADRMNCHDQIRRDVSEGDRPDSRVFSLVRTRLDALKIVAGPSAWSAEMHLFNLVLTEFDRLDRLADYRRKRKSVTPGKANL